MLNKLKKTIYIMLLFIPLSLAGCGSNGFRVASNDGSITWSLFYKTIKDLDNVSLDLDEVNLSLNFGIRESLVPVFYNPYNEKQITKDIIYFGDTYKFYSICLFAMEESNFYDISYDGMNERLIQYYKGNLTLDELNACYEKEKYNFFSLSPVNDYHNLEDIYLIKELTVSDLLAHQYYYIEQLHTGCLSYSYERYETEVQYPKEIFIETEGKGYIRNYFAFCFYSEKNNNYIISTIAKSYNINEYFYQSFADSKKEFNIKDPDNEEITYPRYVEGLNTKTYFYSNFYAIGSEGNRLEKYIFSYRIENEKVILGRY